MSVPKKTSIFFFWLCLAAGLIVLYPSIDFRGFLAPGDHGRDLYAFERTLHGDLPYQDYWWVYGPLMPYYYALLDHLLGVNIMSVLIGKALLTLASGMLLFLTLETLAGGLTGFAGALWFFTFGRDFFFTYNHAGGITCVALIMLCAARYIKNRSEQWLWTGIISAFLLALIKVNFGLAAIPFLLFCAWLTDRAYAVKLTGRKLFFYLFGGIILPLIIGGIYWTSFYGLTWIEIRQCMPYSNADQPLNTLPWIALGNYINIMTQNFLRVRADFFFGIIVICAILRTLFLFASEKLSLEQRKLYLLTLILFGTYYILNFHEFLKSGVWYRGFWSQPAGIVWMFAVIAMALKEFSRVPRLLVLGAVILLCGFQIKYTLLTVRQYHKAEHYLSSPRGKVFTANTLDWMKTVEDTTEYLNRIVPSDETFFALPYDPLYYYLTNRKSPTRQLIFFDHINIPPEQERRIIGELETARINFVLLSSRLRAQEPGLGTLGQTYCPLIADYIDKNFIPVAKFGDWQNEPGWAWNHGTLIYQRKSLRQ